MEQDKKEELIQRVGQLCEGRAIEVRIAEAILDLVRRSQGYVSIAISEAEKGNFAESDPILNQLASYPDKIRAVGGIREVYPGYNSRV